ncbi:uncharacterized protein AMSG_01848 [Thecamonas trahens ATCC 50062]|uniref:Uncharacterized protein n=1 Tax=Thecamonas trahens ATCC 50062 TaxID=461836 RepID=A0A0L0DTQ8_THETB|nr:hypothetical protein AMSG_01848 [Thecamonas trahens ATCC 50062]KNC55582.1 hypothetical protein AMSG_01848 [Thecamonas trahens ATCC 50062]|eukprot:XP_013761355.1 hypothetical protein AMSG_01848 [Thecamonas trahens ATCC 50062]
MTDEVGDVGPAENRVEALNTAGDGGEGGEGDGESLFSCAGVLRMIVIYFIVTSVLQMVTQSLAPPPPPLALDGIPSTDAELRLPAVPLHNAWADGTAYEVMVFVASFGDPYPGDGGRVAEMVTKEQHLDELVCSTKEQCHGVAGLVWRASGLEYSFDAGNERKANVTLALGAEWRVANTTAFAHIFAVKAGSGVDAKALQDGDAIQVVYPLVTHKPPPKIDDKVSLLAGGGDEFGAEEVEAARESGADELAWVPYWSPQLPINVVVDHTVYGSLAAVPEPLRVKLQTVRNDEAYLPAVFVNTFWVLDSSRVVINESVDAVQLEMSVGPLSLMWWLLGSQMEESLATQSALTGGSSADGDMFKRIVLETNPWLLATTGVVTILHMLFDFLAFKNDIQHWRAKKSMRGLSVKSIGISLVFQIVILLYLLENDTTWMILISMAMGIAIEAWKLQKALVFSWEPSRPWIPLRVTGKASYESETKSTTILPLATWRTCCTRA